MTRTEAERMTLSLVRDTVCEIIMILAERHPNTTLTARREMMKELMKMEVQHGQRSRH
jgi:hypothetical protein